MLEVIDRTHMYYSMLVVSFFLAFVHPLFSTDQKPDILIIGRDTILLKNFPLEELNLPGRPFAFSLADLPELDCLRGYQATWKVVDEKLFLVEIRKDDDPQAKIDVLKYFEENNYSPKVIDGLVFADWYTMDLTSFKDNIHCVFFFKTYKAKKCKPTVKFENGLLVFNKYKMEK
jgi:hypothetical protein